MNQIDEIAHLIQLSVAPVFLLTGIGTLLNVLSGRLARIIDRARVLIVRIHLSPANSPSLIVRQCSSSAIVIRFAKAVRGPLRVGSVCRGEGRFVTGAVVPQVLGALRFGPLSTRQDSRVASERSSSAPAKASGLRSVRSRCGNGNSMPCL